MPRKNEQHRNAGGEIRFIFEDWTPGFHLRRLNAIGREVTDEIACLRRARKCPALRQYIDAHRRRIDQLLDGVNESTNFLYSVTSAEWPTVKRDLVRILHRYPAVEDAAKSINHTKRRRT